MIKALIYKRKDLKPDEDFKCHRFAVMIAARNEQAVIAELIKSIKNQKYPKELLDIYVIADNCTDDTARIARNEGAYVYERFNQKYKGKGYALNYGLRRIAKERREKIYEGFFVFDADNVLDEKFVIEMNKMFDKGYRVLTSYRNSKNYYHNWITAGYGLWFLHESEFLNYPRMLYGKSCAISGTGFLIHKDIIRKNGGWKHYLLTEDIEFSVYEIIQGETIGYCRNAVVYDEQPETFKASWNQRLRWSKGFYQVFARYGSGLLKGCYKHKSKFSCFDMLMTVLPAILVSSTVVVINGSFLIAGLLNPAIRLKMLEITISSLISSITIYYGILLIMGAITLITEKNNINCPIGKRIVYLFTFPLFMLTYVPISIIALFKKVEWKPIQHTCVKSLSDIRNYMG